ncbi:hypothetical protein [Maricaulis sp.]|uniref:general secretion pathway protein GspK n=1 Tax=Maricaulis sp. TaxID=1486257 RepID=UPI002B27B6CB|nr:hypothetical protein [Maricaulis sp.]
MRHAETGRDRGSALIYVLWTSSFLAAALLTVTALVHVHIRTASAAQGELTANSILRSALEVAAFDISTGGRAFLASLPTTLQLGEHTVTVQLAPAQRLLDINMADQSQLSALFRQLGESEQAATRLADEILDWRDSDDRVRPMGAEASEYAARRQQAPHNRPFVSVEEVGDVLSVTPRRLACLAPFVTVLGGTPPPARDSGRFAATTDMDGARVALEARLTLPSGHRRTMVGLATFRIRPDVPYQWIAFGEDSLQVEGCTPR